MGARRNASLPRSFFFLVFFLVFFCFFSVFFCLVFFLLFPFFFVIFSELLCFCFFFHYCRTVFCPVLFCFCSCLFFLSFRLMFSERRTALFKTVRGLSIRVLSFFFETAAGNREKHAGLVLAPPMAIPVLLPFKTDKYFELVPTRQSCPVLLIFFLWSCFLFCGPFFLFFFLKRYFFFFQ